MSAVNREAEHSLTAEFGGSLLKKFGKAVSDYRLISEGDRICVCVSGGKDSLLLAKLMQEYKRRGKVGFGLGFMTLDPGFSEETRNTLTENLKALEIPSEIIPVNIFRAASKNGGNPCFLCSRMRRAELYKKAKERGFSKLALGHHFDDVTETVLMGMLYGGQMQTMLPRRKSDHFDGMELIRPMYYIREADINEWIKHNGIVPSDCGCPLQSEKNGGSARASVKELIAELKKTNPQIESNIFRSAENVNLKNLVSYKDRSGTHSFLDDFD